MPVVTRVSQATRPYLSWVKMASSTASEIWSGFHGDNDFVNPTGVIETGPDGGGDGKVDAETYEVTTDISDKWYVADGGASEKEKWAFAISCKKQWKPKVTTDIEKIANTKANGIPITL